MNSKTKRDCRWLAEIISTRVIGCQIASASASIATADDFPDCRQQLSNSWRCLFSSTSTCHGSGLSPHVRKSLTVGGRSEIGCIAAPVVRDVGRCISDGSNTKAEYRNRER